MRYLKVAIPAACAVFLLPACSNDSPSPNPATSATHVITSTSTSEVVTSTTDVTPDGGGADAGPGTTEHYSQAAQTSFISWWNYEVQTPQDASFSMKEIYSAGVSVCLARSQNAGTDTILTVLERDLGLTKSGAAGVYKSALEALCTEYNFGYKTFFDRNVDAMVAVVTPRVSFEQMPPIFQFGFFMKEVCATLEQSGGAVLWNHILNVRPQPELMRGGQVSEQTLRIYIKAAVGSGCSSLNTLLPPVIQMAY